MRDGIDGIVRRGQGQRESISEKIGRVKQRRCTPTREGLFSVTDHKSGEVTIVRVPIKTGGPQHRAGEPLSMANQDYLYIAKGVVFRQVFKRAPLPNEKVDDYVKEVSIVEIDLQKADVLMEFLP